MLRCGLAVAIISVLLTGTSAADPWEDGWIAYQRGEYEAALDYWKPLAERGFPVVQFNIGTMYAIGNGVKQDFAEAAHWYRRAAEQGLAIAQFNLGTMHQSGLGVPRNFTEAARLYEGAAEQGNVDAQVNLAFMYGNGIGVAQDYVRSYMWFSLAAEQKDADAAKNRDLTAELLTQTELELAANMASALLDAIDQRSDN